MEAEKRERRKNRKQENDTAVCVSNVCDRICRSSFGLYSHQRSYTENNLNIIIVVVVCTHARTDARTQYCMTRAVQRSYFSYVFFLFCLVLVRRKYHDSAMYMYICAHGAVIYGMCVSRQNDTLSSRINTHQRFPSNGTGYPWAASPHAVRTQVDDHCRKVQWPCQHSAKVTAANRQIMVFELVFNHCTRWMHWVVSNH